MKSSCFKTKFKILLGLLLITLVPQLQAATLGLTKVFPDFVVDMNGSANIYDFDKNTNTLTITGTIASFTETNPGTQHTVITNSSFSLSATFGNLTNCPGLLCDADITSGSFSLFGEIHDAPFSTVLYDGFVGGFFAGGDANGLFAGDLDDFGWSDSGGGTGQLEFAFTNTSGILATGPLTQGGNPSGYAGGGMILNVNTSDLTDFNDLLNASWTGTGVGDVFVPVPAAVWLFGSGLAGLLGVGTRRRRALQA